MDGSFENVIVKLKEKLIFLIDYNRKLESEIFRLRSILDSEENRSQKQLTEIDFLEKEITRLKASNALLGSEEYKKETKHKINSLIKQIDQCIAQLS